jgi:hypothetical protein
MDFNPFHKPLNNVETKDLLCLAEVYECWYVDYKKEKIKIKEIAKHLCAFANRFGGYIFFGIKQSSDKKAGEFCGISNKDIEQLMVDIREASREHLSPHVIYNTYVFQGPCVDIKLPENNSIVLIHIEKSNNQPHIHSSGRIYIRTDDQSKELTDRHELDSLLTRTEENRTSFSEFVNRIPEVPSEQKAVSWLFVHVVMESEAGEDRDGRRLLFKDFLDCTKTVPEDFGPYILMDSVNAAWRGYHARHIHVNKPTGATAAMRWWHNGDIRFEIPINTYSIRDFNATENYKHSKSFVDELSRQNYQDPLICDFSYVPRSLISLFNMYIHMLNKICSPRNLYATFRITNLHYKIPFMDSGEYVRRCNEYGFPIIQDNEIAYVKKPYYDNMIKLKFDDIKDKDTTPFLFAASMASIILFGVGLVTKPEEVNYNELW